MKSLTTASSEQLTPKELAAKMKRHVSYVYAACARGFHMPGKRATVEEFKSWLARNPSPKSRA